MKITLSIGLMLVTIGLSFAQPDSIYIFNPATHNGYAESYIVDSTVQFRNSEWNYGSEPGFEYLELTPPDSTYNNSGSTDFIPAQNLFSVSSYPVRTAVKLYLGKGDTLSQQCSGTLIAPDLVLTACHCIGNYDSNNVLVFHDSIWAFPAFDNGMENNIFGKSMGIEYITFQSNLIRNGGFFNKDIALIKLENSPGNKTGWLGTAFSTDNNYYSGRVIHKFSYPMIANPFDSTHFFNGDTLYYNYGTPDYISEKSLGYNIVHSPGQSGSSIFYTDNNEYYILGSLVLASIINQHIRITPDIFYGFEHVIYNSINSITTEEEVVKDYLLSDAYPNPFNPVTNITYSLPANGNVNLTLYNILGERNNILVNEYKPRGTYKLSIEGSALSSGIYILTMRTNDISISKKLVLVK